MAVYILISLFFVAFYCLNICFYSASSVSVSCSCLMPLYSFTFLDTIFLYAQLMIPEQKLHQICTRYVTPVLNPLVPVLVC